MILDKPLNKLKESIMTKLVIVESPSKSKTIQKYLGEEYEVLSSKGHINDLATSGKGGLGVDVDNQFKATYKVDKDKALVIKQLKAQAKKASSVYLATDPDREGEAISWHLANELNLDTNLANRVIFNEITQTAVKEAFDHPRPIDIKLVKSQETRRILDRIIGFRLSTLLQRKIKAKSAGRVQSVAVRLIVEKEAEINAFVPEEKWTIKADFNKDEIAFVAEIDKAKGKSLKLKTKSETDEVLSKLSDTFVIDSIEEKSSVKTGKFPFTTSSLQQEAANKLSFSAKKTMRVAQTLYEGIDLGQGQEGLITYMRTDSTRLSTQFVDEAKGYIKDQFGPAYMGTYKVKEDASAQDAHEAIRPSHISYHPESIKDKLSVDEHKLYALIYARTLASLMASPKSFIQTITLDNNGFSFSAKGSKLEFDGYLKVYGKYESANEDLLPKLSEKEVLKSEKIEGIQSFTKPPLRYSEARLIDAMEKFGIGRPSTYASTLDTIVSRAYVKLERIDNAKTKVFIPTDEGILTNSKLMEFFEPIINVDYTKFMEDDLDKIAEGTADNVVELQNFYNRFQPMYEKALNEMEKIEPVKTGRICPTCGGELVERKGRFGVFVACGNYPECEYVEKTEAKAPEYTGDNCPKCGKPLVRRTSRYGKSFVGCSGYPSCRHIEGSDDKGQAVPTETGENCPKCNSPLVIKNGRFGPFVACSNYPKCKYIQPKAKKDEQES